MTEADSETVTAEGSTCAAVSFPGSGFMEAFAHRYSLSILETLLCDRTTGRNIIWADNEYEALGDGYMGDDEITIEKITGPNVNVISRALRRPLSSSRCAPRAVPRFSRRHGCAIR